MAKIPFDFSKFGKISTSDKKTTLKHKDGHFMVVAHKALDGPTRKALDALPFASGGKVPKKEAYKEQPASKTPGSVRSGVRPQDLFPEKYPKQQNPKLEESKKTSLADGGEVADPDPKKAAEMQQGATESGFQPDKWAQNIKEGLGFAGGGGVDKDALLAQASEDYAKTPEGPTKEPEKDFDTVAQDFANHQIDPLSTPASPSPGDTPTQEPDTTAQSAPQASESPPQLPASAPAAPAPSTPTSTSTQPEAEPSISQQIIGHRNELAHDLMAGNIHPKTYANLWGDDNTPAKMGTVFGLLLSGMGSGLSGQPNAMMAMMDKMIDRDVEAQKTDRSNQQSFYKIAQQQVLNDATIKQMAASTGLTKTQAADAWNKAAASGISLQLMRESVGGPSKLTPAQEVQASTMGKHATELAAMHALNENVQKLPQGSPTRQASDAFMAAYAHKKLLQDQPAEAQHAENAEKAAQEQEISPIILAPDWQRKVALAAKYHPLLQDQASELHKQAQNAQQAEKAMEVVNEIFPKMQATATLRGRVARGGSGVLTSLGAGLGAAIAGPKGAGAGAGVGKSFHDLAAVGDEKTKQYEAYKSTLVNSIKTLIPGLTEEEVNNFVNQNAPEEGDEAHTGVIRKRNIQEKIRNSVPHNLLDIAGVYKQ